LLNEFEFYCQEIKVSNEGIRILSSGKKELEKWESKPLKYNGRIPSLFLKKNMGRLEVGL